MREWCSTSGSSGSLTGAKLPFQVIAGFGELVFVGQGPPTNRAKAGGGPRLQRVFDVGIASFQQKRFFERRPPANPGSAVQWRPRVRSGEYVSGGFVMRFSKNGALRPGLPGGRRGGASGKRPETDKVPAFYFRIAGRVKGLTSLTRASAGRWNAADGDRPLHRGRACMRVARPVTLTSEERSTLEGWTRGRHSARSMGGTSQVDLAGRRRCARQGDRRQAHDHPGESRTLAKPLCRLGLGGAGERCAATRSAAGRSPPNK